MEKYGNTHAVFRQRVKFQIKWHNSEEDANNSFTMVNQQKPSPFFRSVTDLIETIFLTAAFHLMGAKPVGATDLVHSHHPDGLFPKSQ